jgi:hypothetical protein
MAAARHHRRWRVAASQFLFCLGQDRQRNHLMTLAIFVCQFGRLKAMYSPE